MAAAVPLHAQLFAQQWVPLDGPSGYGRMAAYDWGRQRLVVLGDGGGTWEFAGGRILQRETGNSSPPPRRRAAMAYDFAQRHVLMFGGIDEFGTMLQDTWVWDGARWRELLTGPRPPVRVDGGIAYDVQRQRIVMYGGLQLFIGQLTDTWEHDGTQWNLRSPATVPGPNSPVLTYDFARGVTTMVLHAGSSGAAVHTWEWDGVDWALRATTGPLSTSNEGLAHDPFRGRTILMGGVGNQGLVWEWDGVAWTSRNVANVPARIDSIVAFDVLSQRTVMFGGYDFTVSPVTQQMSVGAMRTDLWEWDGSTLVRVHGDLRPPSRFGTQASSHLATGDVVLFGGTVAQQPSNDTWLWNGSSWRSPNVAVRPPARSMGAMCEDTGFARVLLFGGGGVGVFYNDLWSWDGTGWSLLDAGSGPSPRFDVTLAHDSRRSRTWLFGGAGIPTTQAVPRFADTWEWTGVAWQQHFPAIAPSPRSAPAMGHDIALDRIVLFGGRVGFTPQDQLQDTWEWDGTVWSNVSTAVSPPALYEPGFVRDPVSGELLLHGIDFSGAVRTTQTWRYASRVWTLVRVDGSSASIQPVVYSDARGRALSVSGNRLREITSTPASAIDLGSGCGQNAPRLLVRTRPRLADSEFGLETSDRADLPVVFVVGDAPASLPIGAGCVVHVGGTLASWFAVPDVFGFTELRLPLPSTLAWRGLQVRAQAAVLDPGAPLGLRLTQGLLVTLGD